MTVTIAVSGAATGMPRDTGFLKKRFSHAVISAQRSDLRPLSFRAEKILITRTTGSAA